MCFSIGAGMNELDYNAFAEFFDRPMTDPKESPKQFARYMLYRNMPKHERSVKLACELLNEKGDDVAWKTLKNTSQKFHWTDRVKAYETHMANLEIEVLETNLEQAVDYVYGQEDIELVMATRLVQRMLGAQSSINFDSMDSEELQKVTQTAQRLINSLDKLQSMRRRRAGLPTNYITKEAEPQDFENQTFIIGGGN